MVNNAKSLLIVVYIVSSLGCFLLFLNDSMALEISLSNYSIALFCFINSDFQNASMGMHPLEQWVDSVLSSGCFFLLPDKPQCFKITN